MDVLSQYTIGYCDTAKVRNGAAIAPLADFAHLESLRERSAANNSKTDQPAIYKYTGVKGGDFRSNVFFIDIDTHEGVDALVDDWENFCEAFPAVIFGQKSFSGKLHVVCGSAVTYTTAAEYDEAFRMFAAVFVSQSKGCGDCVNWHDLDDGKPPVEGKEPEPALDIRESRTDLALFVSGNEILPNPRHRPYKGNLDEGDKRLLKSRYGRFFGGASARFPDAPLREPYEGTATVNRPHVLRIDRTVSINGYSGNDARWRIATAALWIFGGDKAAAKAFLENNFVGGNGSSLDWIDAGKVNFGFVKWLLAEFDILLSRPMPVPEAATTVTFDASTGERLAPGEYLTDRFGEVSGKLQEGRRTLLTANTGAGKTEFVKKFAKEHPGTVVVVPFNSLKEAYATAKGEDGSVKPDTGMNIVSKDTRYNPSKANIVVWDRCVKPEVWEEITRSAPWIFADESHEIFSARSYRKSAAEFAEAIKGYAGSLVAVTATPTRETELLGLQSTAAYTRERGDVPMWVIMTESARKTLRDAVADRAAHGGRMTAVFSNRHARELYDEFGGAEGFGRHTLIHSKTLSREPVKAKPLGWERAVHDIEGQRLSEPLTFFTSAGYSGINFNNTEPLDIFVEYTHGETDAAFIVQCVGRFRKSGDIRLWLVCGKPSKTLDELRAAEIKRQVLAQESPVMAEAMRDFKSGEPVYGDEEDYEPGDGVRQELEDWYRGDNGLGQVMAGLRNLAPYIKPKGFSDNWAVTKGDPAPALENKYRRGLANDFIYNLGLFSGEPYHVFEERMKESGHEYVDDWLRKTREIAKSTECRPEQVCDWLLGRSAMRNTMPDTMLDDLEEFWNAWKMDRKVMAPALAMDEKGRKAFAAEKAREAGMDKDETKNVINKFMKRMEYCEATAGYPAEMEFGQALGKYMEENMTEDNRQLREKRRKAGSVGKKVFVEYIGFYKAFAGKCPNKELVKSGVTKFAFATVGEAQRALGVSKTSFDALRRGKGRLAGQWRVCEADEGHVPVDAKWNTKEPFVQVADNKESK